MIRKSVSVRVYVQKKRLTRCSSPSTHRSVPFLYPSPSHFLEMDIPAEVPEYLLRPLEVVHPSEAVAKRSDFHVSNEVQHELEEMCHTIRNEINDLDREITRRVAVLRDLYVRRNTRVSRFLEIRSTIASHKCLPTEILSQIFSLVCEGSRYAFTPPKKDFTEGCWVLGRVCARWRRVVLSTPKLWESVTIWTPDSIGSLGVDDENRLVAFYADVLSRGVRCLMVVLPRLAGSDFNRPLSHELVVRMLDQFASQLEVVTFACPISGFTQLLELSPLSFSLLTSVVIFVQPDSNYPADPIILPRVTLPSEFTLFKNSPHLTSLHFDGTVRPILPVVFGEPWSHLTVISFGGRLCTALGETQLLLSHCPRLKQCTLCLIHSENDPPHAILENRDQIILQDLFVFEILVSQGYTLRECSSFFQPLVLPSLQLFVLTAGALDLVVRAANENFTTFLARLGPTLQRLTLNLVLQNVAFDRLLPSLSPALKGLYIPTSSIGSNTLKNIALGSILPKLESIACVVSSFEELDAFVDMLERRWGLATDCLSNIVTAIIHGRQPSPYFDDGQYIVDETQPGTRRHLWDEMRRRVDALNTRFGGQSRRIEVREFLK